MCFGGSNKTPEIKQPPPPAPAPTPVEPTEVAALSQDERRKKLSKLRYGLSSTIKTSGKGLTGKAADLTSPILSGKKTLGE